MKTQSLPFLQLFNLAAVRYSANAPSVNKFLTYVCEHFQVYKTTFSSES